MNMDKQWPEIVYVMGIDGSGKTTVAEDLAEQFRAHGRQAEVKWLRFNHVLSKPLLGLCRVLGLTRYEKVQGIRVGYHDFWRSGLISWAFVWLQYFDAVRVRWSTVRPALQDKTRIMVLDRYVYDILIDLMVDTRIEPLDQKSVGRRILKLLPEGTLVLPILRDREALLEARPENGVDDNFERRLRLYAELVERQGLEPIYNNDTLEHLLTTARQRAGLES